MSLELTRRSAIKTGIAAAGLMSGAVYTGKADAAGLADTWGKDFLTPWSPPENVKRDLTPGKTPIRLSCSSHSLHYMKGMDFEAAVKKVRELGYTAAEGGEEWKDASDSEIKTIKEFCKKYDLMFYGLHMCINNIHPDMAERQKNLKRVAVLVETADRMGFDFVVTHTGSCGNNPTETHKDNWTKATWDASVASLKQIIKDTSGSKVNLAVEALNPCNINNPRAHLKLKEDVGDPRVKVTLDPTNMLNPNVYYRMTELINECFDLIGEDICYAHAKDVLWTPDMLPSFKWVVPGTGSNDYAQYLARLSRLKHTRPFMLEFLQVEQYPQAKKYIEETAAKIGVKIYS